MNEEEKRTINFVKKYLEDDTGVYHITDEDIVILMNLVDKQQREIDIKELQLHLQREELSNQTNGKENGFNYEKWVAKMKELEEIENQINSEIDRLSEQCAEKLYGLEKMQDEENTKMVTGYYHILEYCLKQIKDKDKDLFKGVVGVQENE